MEKNCHVFWSEQTRRDTCIRPLHIVTNNNEYLSIITVISIQFSLKSTMVIRWRSRYLIKYYSVISRFGTIISLDEHLFVKTIHTYSRWISYHRPNYKLTRNDCIIISLRPAEMSWIICRRIATLADHCSNSRYFTCHIIS